MIFSVQKKLGRLSLASFTTLGALAMLGYSDSASAWGPRGHTVINEAAVDLMTSPAAGFFARHRKDLGRLANIPDTTWKQAAYQEERPYHFFHWDVFGETPYANQFNRMVIAQVVEAFGQPHLNDNGTAPWRIGQIFQMAVNALKAKEWERAIQLAGVLGHYVGDLSNPMHVTHDYDGQSIGRRGVHAYFETTLVDTVPVPELLDADVREGAPVRVELDRVALQGSACEQSRQIAINESVISLAEHDDILDNFTRNSQNDEALREFFGPRMGAASATLAKLWDMIAIESGMATRVAQEAPRGIQVRDPSWFAINEATAAH